MAQNTANFTTSSIDYDGIKEALKNSFKDTKEFSDYNFEGSGLEQIINVLAYNTHYNIDYDSFALNESFLDTAVKKSSVISHAGALNYMPRSAKCPEAVLSITVKFKGAIADAPAGLTIPAYSKFSTKIDGVSKTFYNLATYSASSTTGTYQFDNIVVYGGNLITDKKQYNGDSYQIFSINNSMIDTDTLKVSVLDSSGTYNTYTRVGDFTKLEANSKIYFLHLRPDETYHIQFGDGTLGRALETGDIVTISYLASDGTVCNGATTFECNNISSNYTQTCVCTQAAVGGAEPEDIESIRFNAPRYYTTQNRCVTAWDYKALIQSEYANAAGINVWGGEDNEPPEYGKTFISIVKKNGEGVTADEQEYILNNILNEKKELTAIIEFKDPYYLGINISDKVYYNPEKTNYSPSKISELVSSVIEEYCNANIGGFDDKIRVSNLAAKIDSCDASIVSNELSFELVYDFEPTYNVGFTYSVKTNNPIHQSEISSNDVLSNGFYCTETNAMCYIDDDPKTSTLRLFTRDSLGVKQLIKTIGVIDYSTGEISIESITITGCPDGYIRLTIQAESGNIASKRNQFCLLNNIFVSVVTD